MTKGVVLVAFGKRGYAYAACNMAVSIKHYNPLLSISLLCDNKFEDHLTKKSDMAVFDQVIRLPDRVLFSPHGGHDPALTKISIYEFLPYDYNLYLDVDGVAMQDITPVIDALIEKGGYYYTHIFGSRTLADGNENEEMVWAWMHDIWDHYKLPRDARLPATNSSIQFIKKSKEAKDLFDQIQKNYSNPIPVDRLRLKWGGGQPDELYLNIALCQKGWQDCDHYVFFGNRISEMTFEQIEKRYYILSIFGGRGFTRECYMEWYDRLLFRYYEARGKEHLYKRNYIVNDKHANQVNSKVQFVAPITVVLEKGVIPISQTGYINSNKLIQSYKGPNGKDLKITNWLNPSWIEFKCQKIMAYRMECVPFCTFTKIGLVRLDDDFEPIQETNTIPELHSELRGFSKGYHVEDPRLFEHDNKLYLSYTDGYSMLQSEIDPKTLQAKDGFYIRKPAKERIEKNWTFFQQGSNLYAVYQIAPHTIYRMEGQNFQTLYEQEWGYNEKGGLLKGGSSPVLTDDGFLSFFHYTIDFKEGGRQYMMGAYLFDKDPPFNLLAITDRAIVAGEQIPTGIPRLSNKIYVVFPGGAIRHKDGWRVSFGYNDYQCRYVDVSDDYLNANLKPITQEATV